MSATRASPTAMQPNQPDVSPGTSQTPSRANEAMLADELSNIGDLVKWPRAPELREFEQMASLITASGCYFTGESTGASSAERTQLYEDSADGRPG